MRTILNFNEGWLFRKDWKEVPASLPADWESVTLPHTWNAIDGQDGGNDYFRGTCCYAKTIIKAELPQAQKYYLEIRGANSSADVYLNGKSLAHHDGGYSNWRVDLTDSLELMNLLVIAVDNSANDRVYPQMADFTFYGGIYRDVNLLTVNKNHFDLDYFGGPGIAVTPTVAGKDGSVRVRSWHNAENGTVSVLSELEGGVLIVGGQEYVIEKDVLLKVEAEI